jgi:Cu2+-exporting ATPase
VVSGKIYIRVAKTSGESSATKIADILNHTTEYKSFTVLRAERFSRQLVKPTFITSAIALPILGFNSAVGVILCHPKERLKIAAPISLLRYLKRGIDEGILIKDGRSLELFNQVDTIVFDKTGTLTEAQPSIGEIYSYTGLSADEILRYAAIAEHRQTHPLAKAILQEARARELSLDQPTHSEYLLGYGVKIIIENCVVLVGSRRFMESENISMKDSAAQLESHCAEQGRGVVMVALDGRLIGAIALVPTIRAEAKEVMAKLKQLKQIKKTYIISGDAEAPTQQLAHELGIDGYFAQTLPQRKAELIKELQQQGAFVCFIGDGINDAIAMKQAQVSVSLNGASQLATDTAQILFMDQGIRHLPRLFELAKGYHSHMNNQLTIVLGCSILGISSVFLGGWGMGNMMVLNMLSILGTLGYSAMDRTPPTQMDKHHLQKNQLILQKPPPIDAVNILPLTTLGD